MNPILASDKISNLLLLAEPSVPNERFISFAFSKVTNGIPRPSFRLETGQLTKLALVFRKSADVVRI